MPIYTVETAYKMPVMRNATYSAETPEDACRLAIGDDDWSAGRREYESGGETYVVGIWKGRNAAWSGPEVAVPDKFGETVQRKAELFDELVAILREPARPMGLSWYQFEHWLPRALAILAKADAIIGCRVPPRP